MSEIDELRRELNSLKARFNTLTLGSLDSGSETLSRAEFVSPFPTSMTNDVESAEFSGIFRSVKGYTFDGVVYHWGIVVLGVLQVGANASGQLLWGAGNVIGDANGIQIYQGTGLPNQIGIYDDNGKRIGFLRGTLNDTVELEAIHVEAGSVEPNRILHLYAYGATSGTPGYGRIVLEANDTSDAKTQFYISGDGKYIYAGRELILGEWMTLPEVSAPATPDSGYGSVYVKTDGKLYFKNDAGTETFLGVGAAVQQSDFQFSVQCITSVTTTITNDANFRWGYYRAPSTLTDADGDEYLYQFVLDAGTYTMYTYGAISQACGIVDYYLDGSGTAFSTGQDWYYAGGATRSEKSVASVVISAGGRHTIKVKVNGKNASATDYIFACTAIWFVPSAYTVGA